MSILKEIAQMTKQVCNYTFTINLQNFLNNNQILKISLKTLLGNKYCKCTFHIGTYPCQIKYQTWL